MSEFTTVTVRGKKYCPSLENLKEFVTNNTPFISVNGPSLDEVEMGYFEPGHGSKGRKVWLYDDDDILDMYEKHDTKKRITLWCYSGPTNQPARNKPPSSAKSDDAGKKGSSNYDSQLKRQTEVNEVFVKLKEKHAGQCKPEQLRTWAHMYQMGTHASLDEPPDKPFFRGRKRDLAISDTGSETPQTKKSAPSSVISPGRKASIRTQLIDQLQKCQQLAESGAISHEIYGELQGTILSDIK